MLILTADGWRQIQRPYEIREAPKGRSRILKMADELAALGFGPGEAQTQATRMAAFIAVRFGV